VPYREDVAVVEVDAADGGLLSDAADPGRREAVGVRLTVVFGAVLSRRLLMGGDGRGGIVPGCSS